MTAPQVPGTAPGAPPPSPVGAPDLALASQYIAALTGSADATITFQSFDDIPERRAANTAAFDAGQAAVKDPYAHVIHGTLAGCAPVLHALNLQGAGVFVCVNQTDLRGRENRSIVGLRAAFVDKDDGPLDPAKITLPPSFRVRTPGGEHAYWRLQRHETIADFKPLQKRLIAYFGSDPQVNDLARVLRLPGFYHCKGWPSVVPIADVWIGDVAREYTIEELLAAYPAVRLISPGRPPKAPTPPAAAPDQRTDPPVETRLARARAYLASLPPSIQGNGGSVALFKAIMAVYRGFVLPRDIARELIVTDFNVAPRSVPEWSDAELDHKFDDVEKIEDVPWGYVIDTREDPAIDAWVAARRAPPGPLVDASGATLATRPTVIIDTEESRVNDDAIAALALVPNVYQRGSSLVRIVHDDGKARRLNLARPIGAPVITAIAPATLQEILANAARWIRIEIDEKAVKEGPAHPPPWSVKAVHARGQWAGVRALEAVVESPVLRADGSILSTPGYDEATGLFYEPSPGGPAFPPVPEFPTGEEVDAASDLLLDVVCDFPFASPSHKAAWFAGLLTCFARFAFSGPAPLFAIDANVRGCGKSLLAELVGLIAAGRPVTKLVQGEDEDEDRKRITALALAGDRFVNIDNVAKPLGNGALDLALTTTEWSDRRLGKNENIREPLFVVWWATGNNIVYAGDIVRRTAHIRLESPMEKPEERGDFSHGNAAKLRDYVIAHRGELVAAALTVLRGYFADGAPDMGLTPWGSFDAWSALIRNAVVWAGLEDPGDTRSTLAATSDNEAGALAALLAGWEELCSQPGIGVDIAKGVRGCRTSEAVKAVENWRRSSEIFGAAMPGGAGTVGGMPGGAPRCQKLVEALDELLPGHALNARSLSRVLQKMRQRPIAGRYLVGTTERGGFMSWGIKRIN